MQLFLKSQLAKLKQKLEFQLALINKRPYFGQHLVAFQRGSPSIEENSRFKHMWDLIRHEFSLLDRKEKDNFLILEVGSWAGRSAVLWASALKEFNNGNGLIFAIDPFLRYMHSQIREKNDTYDLMDKAVKNDDIIHLFFHNIKAAGYEDTVRFIRAKSQEILPLLKADLFNLIYVDGDHTYEHVLKDLKNSAPLVKDGGILCGDDLVLLATEIDRENARKHANMDHIKDPITNQWFHPGVTLAAADFFGEVSAQDGFFAMKKRGQGWEKIDFNFYES